MLTLYETHLDVQHIQNVTLSVSLYLFNATNIVPKIYTQSKRGLHHKGSFVRSSVRPSSVTFLVRVVEGPEPITEVLGTMQ